MSKPYWQQRQEMKLKQTTGMTGISGKSGKKVGDKEEKPTPVPPDKRASAAPLAKRKIKGHQKKIKARTKKQAKTMKDLAVNYGPFLEKNPICQIQAPGCTHKATCVHHKAGRGVTAVLDQTTWEPSCHSCNDYVETYDQWARDNGHKITRLGTPKKFSKE